MPRKLEMEHVAVYVPTSAFEKTLRFYQEGLGWHRVQAEVKAGGGKEVVWLSDGAMVLEVICGEGRDHVAYVTPLSEFDATRARLEEYDGVAFEPPINASDGGLVSYSLDPAGRWIQLVGCPDEMPPLSQR